MKKFFLFCSLIVITLSSFADDRLDSEGYPEFYVRGVMTGTWSVQEAYKFTRTGDNYEITLDHLDGQFKISGTDWKYNFGAPEREVLDISDAWTFLGKGNGPNLNAVNLKDVTIRFTFPKDGSNAASTVIYISANGHEAPAYSENLTQGPLPILHINVYREGTREFDNEVIDRNLAHKNYFSGEYWLEMNGCEWMKELGAEDIGSEEEPLPLEIKARGNYTRTAYAKKPFKLKLGKKQTMLGLSKSKHFAILAHADDNFGYLRNFTGFSLGHRIGLPWTPSQQPVEVYINGDYRGLYFLTESIRVEEERVNIAELNDNETDPSLISGGYLVELDNYEEENQIRMEEKSFVGGYRDLLRITWDTPEEYSDIQKRFVTEQFEAMNDAVGDNSDLLWSYLDLDDAVRYYLVEEMISHVEAYHGSTYLFRDRDADQKWHFSPLWDCGNAFNGPTEGFFYHHDPFGNTWIESIRQNQKFNDKLKETWLWFMNTGFKGLEDEINNYAAHISEAAKRDRTRWKNAPRPDGAVSLGVVDNSNLTARKEAVLAHINGKINWLKSQFGDYTSVTNIMEPERDDTPAAPLPDYVIQSGVRDIMSAEVDLDTAIFYTLDGLKVDTPAKGRIYIAVTPEGAVKVKF